MEKKATAFNMTAISIIVKLSAIAGLLDDILHITIPSSITSITECYKNDFRIQEIRQAQELDKTPKSICILQELCLCVSKFPPCRDLVCW